MTRKKRKAHLQELAESLLSRYSVQHVSRSAYRGQAYLEDGRRIVNAPKVTGYVSFAILCHEVFHHTLGHTAPLARKRTSAQELECWGAVRLMFKDHALPWTNGVVAFMRSALARMILEDIPPKERSTMDSKLKAIQLLDSAEL